MEAQEKNIIGNLIEINIMELWIIFAIGSAVFGGLFNFILKTAAHKKYNVSELLVGTYLAASIMGLVVFGHKFASVDKLWLIILYAALNAVTYFFVHRLRIKSLKFIDSTIYFPVYKTIGPIIILFVSFLVFRESLNTQEWVGVVLGIITSWLLVSKSEEERQNNLKKGLSLMFVGTLLTTVGIGLNKFVNISGLDKELFIVVTSIFLLIITAVKLKQENQKKSVKLFTNKRVVYLGIINGVIVLSTAYLMILALEGNIAIVYTINSFSILITVLLSVFFFKEHFNIRKALAVIASVLAGIFFIN